MGKWRMRLIGSLDPIPSPMKTDLNSSFVTKEMHDYYVPNDKNIIMRYKNHFIKTFFKNLAKKLKCVSLLNMWSVWSGNSIVAVLSVQIHCSRDRWLFGQHSTEHVKVRCASTSVYSRSRGGDSEHSWQGSCCTASIHLPQGWWNWRSSGGRQQ